MGRAPCCDKANVKKGPWSPEEDAKLKAFIEQHGTGGNWIALPQKIGLKRCGKSCRLRWLNYLRPNIKHGGFSEEEDNIICSLYISIGSRWSIIAAQLPGRTDNDIKNYWNTRLKKKLLGKQRKEQARKGSNPKQDAKRSNGNLMIAENTIHNHHPYWPDPPSVPILPLPSSNQGARSHDDHQTSLKKLLIKLGGRFSNDPHLPFTANGMIDVPPTSQNLYCGNPNNLISSSTPMNYSVMDLPGSSSLLSTSVQYDADRMIMHMLQDSNGFPLEFDEIVFGCSQRLGADSFYGLGMVNGGNGNHDIASHAHQSNSSSLNLPPPFVASAIAYDGCQLDSTTLQERSSSSFDEARYLALQ
ncbi:hypothetical protein ACLOJK_036085 [Asimina triloba]